jgi:tetratricopeptide (TPR) repeat protein
VALDRQAEEQQAQRFLKKGQFDEAIGVYKKILREDVRDRRMRQKLADLYERSGRTDDAEKHYEELVRLYTQDGNHRAALAVNKQLVKIAPKNMERLAQLADSYLSAGFPGEAEKNLLVAVEGMAHKDPGLAADYGFKLQELRPGDLALRIRIAEMLSLARRKDEAYDAFVDVIGEMRRRGRMDEVGRMASQALVLRPDEPDLLQDAADACLASGDATSALKHLQLAYQNDPKDPRTLDLLGRCFEMGDDPSKARPVLVALAEILHESGDYKGRASALSRAAAAGAEDVELAAQAEQARLVEEIAGFRLTALDALAPADEDMARKMVRAEVLLAYGLAQKALDELDGSPEAVDEDEGEEEGEGEPDAEAAAPAEPSEPDPPGLVAARAELLAGLGKTEESAELARTLLEVVSGADRDTVERRIAALEGRDLTAWLEGDTGDAPEAAPEEAPEAAAETPEAESPEEETPEDDTDVDDLLKQLDLGSEDAFAKDDAGLLGSLFEGDGAVADVDPDDFGGDAAAEGDTSGGALEEAKGLLALGLVADARAKLEGVPGLAAAALAARCIREEGDVGAALTHLRNALDDADDADTGHPDVLFELADLTVRQGKHRAALRHLRELEDLFPSHRPGEVSTRVQAIKKLMGG